MRNFLGKQVKRDLLIEHRNTPEHLIERRGELRYYFPVKAEPEAVTRGDQLSGHRAEMNGEGQHA